MGSHGKAVADTEQLTLSLKQMVRNLSLATTFSTVTAKAHDALTAKALAKVTPGSTSMLTADYDPNPTSSCKGMELVEEMRLGQ